MCGQGAASDEQCSSHYHSSFRLSLLGFLIFWHGNFVYEELRVYFRSLLQSLQSLFVPTAHSLLRLFRTSCSRFQLLSQPSNIYASFDISSTDVPAYRESSAGSSPPTSKVFQERNYDHMELRTEKGKLILLCICLTCDIEKGTTANPVRRLPFGETATMRLCRLLVFHEAILSRLAGF